MHDELDVEVMYKDSDGRVKYAMQRYLSIILGAYSEAKRKPVRRVCKSVRHAFLPDIVTRGLNVTLYIAFLGTCLRIFLLTIPSQ